MDPLSEIGVFVRVVEKRSFTLAARTMGLTASGVSRAIARLEGRLGVRLLERTTRSVGLTADGAVYYERCTRILRELEDADRAVASTRSAPRGRLRVDAPSMFGSHVLGPAIGRFLAAYPELSVDLSLRDHLVDPIAEGIDVVLRMAKLRESELMHKHLGTMPLVIVGTPAYFARRGRPVSVEDLRRHDTLGFLVGSMPLPWKLRHEDGELALMPTGRFYSNGIGAILEAARASQGIVQVFEHVVREDLARGTFEAVLRAELQQEVPVAALYAKEKAQLPKVRVFLDFMAELMRATSQRVGPEKRREGVRRS